MRAAGAAASGRPLPLVAVPEHAPVLEEIFADAPMTDAANRRVNANLLRNVAGEAPAEGPAQGAECAPLHTQTVAATPPVRETCTTGGMSPPLMHTMRLVGHVARLRTLRDSGVTSAEIADGIRDGTLWRPKKGWVATRLADRDQVRAVTAGARIGCVSALRRWGVWSGDGDALHLHVATTTGGLDRHVPPSMTVEAVPLPHPSIVNTYGNDLDPIRRCDENGPVIHWSEQRFEGALDWIVSIEDALAQAVRCQSSEHAVACIDSALHVGAISLTQWERIRETLPRRLERLDERKDARAGSGNETKARLRLLDEGFRVQPQFFLLGAGTVDMLVEDCVIVEVDSEAHHGSPAQRRKDRVRILVAQLYGIPTVSIGPESFTDENWQLVMGAIHRQVADARQLKQARRVIVRG
ncbi:hypothetical protein OH146_05275 [Salinibacterium sp. SYSU T00001]|uniref:hypothetical protein n=1 Tax=Homoserinimonas sedimenticola TaxID=2986805 RepID=UPI0022354653|nr:hypothetical protein [Salinibacterium sedimenticola]MCW4385183.1 hypothetical protein [Salinibacterium sedimenticola]